MPRLQSALCGRDGSSGANTSGLLPALAPKGNPTRSEGSRASGESPEQALPSPQRGKGHGNGRQTRGQKQQGQQSHQAPQQGLAPQGPLDMRYILPLVLRMLLRQKDELNDPARQGIACLWTRFRATAAFSRPFTRLLKLGRTRGIRTTGECPTADDHAGGPADRDEESTELLSDNAEAQEMAIKNQWAVRQGKSLYWQFQSWDPVTAKVIIHPKREPILMSTMEERIEEALILCRSEGLLHRFHATRRLNEEPKSP